MDTIALTFGLHYELSTTYSNNRARKAAYTHRISEVESTNQSV
jgi:hypothetical protein